MRSQLERLKKSVSGLAARIGSCGFAVLGFVLVYGIVFSYFCVLKHDVFRSFAWDLGIFDQSLYTTVFSGRFMYYTAELYMVPSGCYFASHFSPFLLLLVPFYMIHPGAETLLVLQSFALAAAAFPLYLLSKTALGSKKEAVVIAGLFLLYPALQGANWFDFHTPAFLPFLLFSMYYLFQAKRWRLYLISTVLALATEEHVAIVVCLMAVYFLAVSKPKTVLESIRSRRTSQSLISVVTIVIGSFWFFLAQSVKGSFSISPQFLTQYKATSAFGVLGINSDPLFLPIYIILNPQNAWNALVFDYPTKLFFLLVLFGPLIFLSLRSKFSLITIALLVSSILSDYLAYHTIGAQYPLYVIPLIFIAFVISLQRFVASSRRSLLKIAFFASLIFIISLSPISPLSGTFARKELVWYPSLPDSSSGDIKSLNNLIILIPSQSSVLTQNHIFPHVSARINAYVIPTISFENETYYLNQLINKSEYVLLDLWAWDPGTAMVFNEMVKNSTYGIYGLGSRSLLFKRDYQGPPFFAYYVENRFFQAFGDLRVNGLSVVDPSSRSSTVALWPKGQSGLVVYGAYTYLLPGKYNITFSIKTGEHDDGYIGALAVVDDANTVLSRKDVYGFEIKSTGWINFTLPLSSTTLKRLVQFEVFSAGSAETYVDGVYLQRTSTNASDNFGSMTFNSNNLLFDDSKYEIENGLLVHFKNTTSEFFWWGPYISLQENDYRATFFLRFSPFPSSSDERLLSLDVTAKGGQVTLARYDVHLSDLNNGKDNSSVWQKITLDFSAKTSLENVEFRGLSPSSNYNIYLALILLEKAS